MKRISLVCALLVLFGGTQALAETDTQAYIEQAQNILSQKNIRNMMDIAAYPPGVESGQSGQGIDMWVRVFGLNFFVIP